MRLALWDIAVPLLCRTEREGPRDQGDDAQSKHLEDTAVNLKGAVELPDLGLSLKEQLDQDSKTRRR